MLTLTGKLRQFTEVQFADRPERKGGTFLKLWLEHETPRDGEGPGDLKIEELLLPVDAVPAAARSSLKADSVISVAVRAWARGRDVAFQAVGLVPRAGGSPGPSVAR